MEADLHGSDHHPVILVELLPVPVTREPRHDEKRADWDGFYEGTSVDNMFESHQNENINSLVSIYNNLIISSADTFIPKTKQTEPFKRVPWWSTECSTANYERRRALRRYQRTRTSVDKVLLNRATARAKYVKRQARRMSWRKYVDSLSVDTPMSKVWSRVCKMRGLYKPHPPPIIRNTNQELISEPEAVAEVLADHYESVSSSENYSNTFRRIQANSESNRLNFTINSNLSYNAPFTISELNHSLRNCKNSAPGQDKISYKMIYKSHITAKHFLLSIYNKIWTTHEFPTLWRMGTVVSFLKPYKNSQQAQSYRPISLTSCVSKLMEKMVNTRLVQVLESRGLLPEEQSGFRKMRSTSDSLVRFTSDIMSAFLSKQLVLCVSFDLEKVYDTTWRHNILTAIHESEIRGHLPLYIQNFLTDRHFRSKIGSKYSSIHLEEQGVPQGSVISCSLFSLAINNMLKTVPPGIKSSLYVDDLLLYTAGNYQAGLERRLQLGVNRVKDWAQSHGFKFSNSKTISILFHRR